MVKNKTIIDKLITKYYNCEQVIFDDKFDEYISTYDVNKHNSNTNAKIILLLSIKFSNQLESEYNKWIEKRIDKIYSTEGPQLYSPTYDQIDMNAQLYTQARYSQLINNDPQYNIIKQIKQKYGYELQKEVLIYDSKLEADIEYTKLFPQY
jgi:hypothetical protein